MSIIMSDHRVIVIWIIGAVLIYGLGCYGTIKIFHTPPISTIAVSLLVIPFLLLLSYVGKMCWDTSVERKTIESKCLTSDDPKTFLEAIEFYSTLNRSYNARTNIPRAKEISEKFVEKILSERTDFLNDQQIVALVALLVKLDMEEDALLCIWHCYSRKT